MLKLTGNKIKLRALEPKDLPFLADVENDESYWDVSSTLSPFAEYTLAKYIEESHQDIFEAKQLRLVISLLDGTAIGFIDLFDFDPLHKRAGVGIVLIKNYRGQGKAKESLLLLSNYAFKHLGMHQLYASVLEDNQSSLKLFQKVGFEIVGLKKDWHFSNGVYKNEYLLQKINHVH